MTPDDQAFLRASRVLTGIEELPAFLAPHYRARAETVCGAVDVGALLAVPPDSLLSAVSAAQALRVVAEQIVMLWYASATVDANGVFTFGSPREYFAGQLWPVIQAHPPGLSGGYMGHWRYPPE
jgi:hypothetical protein